MTRNIVRFCASVSQKDSSVSVVLTLAWRMERFVSFFGILITLLYLQSHRIGGTVDGTGDLEEPCNATEVDDTYIRFLTEITGEDVMGRFCELHRDDYIELFRDFDEKKQEFIPGDDTSVVFRIPVAFTELVKEMTGMSMVDNILKSKFKDTVSFEGDKLKVDASVAKSLFDGTLLM